MSDLDQFAAAALTGLLARETTDVYEEASGQAIAAQDAYDFATAMLREREKRQANLSVESPIEATPVECLEVSRRETDCRWTPLGLVVNHSGSWCAWQLRHNVLIRVLFGTQAEAIAAVTAGIDAQG